MINSVYGKTMENLQKRINVRLVNYETDFSKYTSRPTHIIHNMLGKNYAAIYEIKPVLMLNKPIFVGFTVLELSKWLMYDFHQNFIKNHVGAKSLFTDTDSPTYEIKIEDVYKEFLSTNICSTLVTIQKIQSYLTRLIKKLLAKSRMLKSLAGCLAMFLFAGFCEIGALERDAYWFYV